MAVVVMVTADHQLGAPVAMMVMASVGDHDDGMAAMMMAPMADRRGDGGVVATAMMDRLGRHGGMMFGVMDRHGRNDGGGAMVMMVVIRRHRDHLDGVVVMMMMVIRRHRDHGHHRVVMMVDAGLSRAGGQGDHADGQRGRQGSERAGHANVSGGNGWAGFYTAPPRWR